jgi:hypothetical protein
MHRPLVRSSRGHRISGLMPSLKLHFVLIGVVVTMSTANVGQSSHEFTSRTEFNNPSAILHSRSGTAAGPPLCSGSAGLAAIWAGIRIVTPHLFALRPSGWLARGKIAGWASFEPYRTLCRRPRLVALHPNLALAAAGAGDVV